MTNKEIGELRRRMKPDRTNLTAVYGCYVASSGEVLSTFREPFGLMAEEDKEKYLAIFRRALSGTPDKNLIDLSFTTKQVADSNEHRLLMRLRETALDDEEARQKLFQTIIGAVNFEENFLICWRMSAMTCRSRLRTVRSWRTAARSFPILSAPSALSSQARSI